MRHLQKGRWLTHLCTSTVFACSIKDGILCICRYAFGDVHLGQSCRLKASSDKDHILNYLWAFSSLLYYWSLLSVGLLVGSDIRSMETTQESSLFKDPTRPIEGTTASFQVSGSAHQDDFGCIWKLSVEHWKAWSSNTRNSQSPQNWTWVSKWGQHNMTPVHLIWHTNTIAVISHTYKFPYIGSS